MKKMMRATKPHDEAIPLRMEHRQQLRDLALLINHHRNLIAQIEGEASHICNVAYGVDIRQGGWEINLDRGAIIRASPQQIADIQPSEG